MGVFLFTLLAALCALERELIGERTKSALDHMRAKGQIVGRIPYGYAGIDGMQVESPEEQKTLKRMQAMRAQGMNLIEIAQALNDAKIPKKRGEGVWESAWVGRLLRRADRGERLAEEQKNLKWMQDMRAQGMQLKEIAQALNDAKIPKKRGGVWESSWVSKLLRKTARRERLAQSANGAIGIV